MGDLRPPGTRAHYFTYLTLSFTSDDGLQGITADISLSTVAVSAALEPSSLTLLAVGGLGLLALARRHLASVLLR